MYDLGLYRDVEVAARVGVRPSPNRHREPADRGMRITRHHHRIHRRRRPASLKKARNCATLIALRFVRLKGRGGAPERRFWDGDESAEDGETGGRGRAAWLPLPRGKSDRKSRPRRGPILACRLAHHYLRARLPSNLPRSRSPTTEV